MKKIILLILPLLLFISCNSSQRDLDFLEANVKQHIKYKDADNGTITKINNIKAISIDKISDENKKNPEEAYLSRVFIQGTWSYLEGNRIFNFSDTINCYLDKNKKLIEIDNIYNN